MKNTIVTLAVSLIACNAAFSSAPEVIETVVPKVSKKDFPATEMVIVEASVTRDGKVIDARVLNSDDPKVVDPLLTAVNQWKFDAAESGGEKIDSRVRIPFTLSFETNDPKEALRNQAPVLVSKNLPQLPEAMETVPAYVKVAISITETGSVSGVEVAASSHPEFEACVLSTVSNWEFKPAVKDGSPIACVAVIPFSFNSGQETMITVKNSNPTKATKA